jgi:glucan-binding YG repeat protein
MAIDMIEDNELAALSQSRIGSIGFVDDDNFGNFLGLGVGYGLLKRTSNEKKQVTEAQLKQQNAELQYKYLVTSKDTCDTIQKKLTAIDIEIELNIANNLGKKEKKNVIAERKLATLREIEANLKTKYSDLDCFKKELQSEKEKEKKENLDVFNTLTNTPPSIATDTEGNKSNTNKYIIYGVGGIILLTGIILLLKNK